MIKQCGYGMSPLEWSAYLNGRSMTATGVLIGRQMAHGWQLLTEAMLISGMQAYLMTTPHLRRNRLQLRKPAAKIRAVADPVIIIRKEHAYVGRTQSRANLRSDRADCGARGGVHPSCRAADLRAAGGS